MHLIPATDHVTIVPMLKFRGFRASLNFGYTNKNKDEIENYPTGPENISLAGAYKANREEFFGMFDV